MTNDIVQYCFYDSPFGQILLAGTSDDVLLLLGLPHGKSKHKPEATWKLNPRAFAKCRVQLAEYFAGKRKVFDLEFQIRGSEFKERVLNCVYEIPYGTTKAYSAIAQQIKQPAAMRAVGGANAKNPIPIIVPCHRVIGKNGSLTGFGGGIDTKRFLLELEGLHYN